MKIKLLFFFTLCTFVNLIAQGKKDVWKGFIEIEQGLLQKHVITDLPGSIIVFVPDAEGKYTSKILGNKVLKDSLKLPELKSQPIVLREGFAKKESLIGISYLGFINTEMSNSDEVRLTITETSNASIIDNEINWNKFDKRISNIKSKNQSLPQGTFFAIIKAASIITIDYQTFSNVDRPTKISGFGFAAENKYLSQKSNKSLTYKVGISLAYSDDILDLLALGNSELGNSFKMITQNSKGTEHFPHESSNQKKNGSLNKKKDIVDLVNMALNVLVLPTELKTDIVQ